MRALLCLLLTAACVLADDSENRRSKLPYVADAVGNTLPPPSSGPATVGSPVNLLTPDRYEFYTFDESGELVKRLMTLEEIQAIVAAGEEAEGLVTFANENQPTIAFNFSQPPYTKVHSVVTNVQNVLKAQMEAHKNRPLTQPTLDTPDVSDSWSLILPSIFGNTGVDIVPDKMSGTFTTPETETIDLERPIDDNSLSKEGNNRIISSSSTKTHEEVSVTEKLPSISSTTEKLNASSLTTITTTKTTPKPTTEKPLLTTTLAPSTTITSRPTTTSRKPTTIKLRTTTSTTTSRPQTSTTVKPTTSTTLKPTTQVVKVTPKPTTVKPNLTTKKIFTTHKETEPNFTKIQTFTNNVFATDKNTVQYEKISTFVPLSTAAYVTERATQKYEPTTKASVSSTTKRYLPSTTKAPYTTVKVEPFISTYKPSNKITTLSFMALTPKDEVEKFNATTVTTQSVSPSTTISSTEFISIAHHPTTEKNVKPFDEKTNDIKEVDPEINFFDVAQSFSQIASDLGGEYQPVPTTTDLLDITKLNDTNLESKENVEIEIPPDAEKPVEVKDTTNNKKPLEVLKSAVDHKPTKNENPADGQKPAEVQKPTKNEKPAEGQKLAEVQKPIKIEKPLDVKKPIEVNKPVEVIKPEDVQNLSKIKKPIIIKNSTEVRKPGEVQIPTKVENPAKAEMPVKVEKPIEETNSELNDKNADNFVQISTLVPHQNEDKVLKKDTNVKTDSKSTVASTSKVEMTTSFAVISTTIDPVLSESMDNLFSQVVNQAPQSIFDPNDVSQNSTTEVPKSSIKQDKPKESELSAIKKDNLLAKIKDQLSDNKNMTNEIPQMFVEEKETEKIDNKPLEQNKNNEGNKTSNEKPQQTAEIKQNLLKISETTTKKEENIESTSQKATINEDIKNSIKISQDLKKQTIVNENHKLVETRKKEEHEKATTTTEVSTKMEFKKPISSTIKPESTPSNANKIVALDDNNKTNKIKESEIVSVEPQQLPKVDEFKKKIQKVNIDDKELVNDHNNSWKLISTVTPPKANEIPKDKHKTDSQENTDKDIVLDFSKENQGLEVTTKDLGEDIAQFTELCNELAFRYWQAMTESIEKRRSFILSPYSITSMLAMMFMGARGATSGEMNEILKLDDMVTFNPHFTLKNISDSIETTPSSGVIVSAFVRELFSDRSKGKILTFYKERAQHFYNGHVEEINFKLISDIIRRRTNLLVKRYTWGRIVEYMKSNTITMQPPLAAFSTNIFQTDCSGSSVEGRDGEMYFVVSPNVRQRRLVPVPAVVYRSGFLAGYDPALDATAAALGNTNSVISTLFLMPGQQGNVVHAEDLEALEKRLLDSNPTTPAWNRLLRTLLPRIGLELQIPRFSHKSIFNVSTTLQKMGLKELFDPEHADLGGLNGPSKDLYLSDMVQSTMFVTCGEGVIGEQHHIEEYPESLHGPQRRRTSRWATGWDEPRDYQRAFHDPHDVSDAMNLPLHLRPRQARLPSRNAQPARLKFDRPFLYFVRHNPSGMILYVGRYNPRLLP